MNGYTITGTVTFNASGNASAANLTLNDPNVSNSSGLQTFNQISMTSAYNGLSQNYLTNSANSGQIALYVDTNADGNGWFDLCLGNTQCGTTSGTVDPSTLQIYGLYHSSTNTSNSGLALANFTSGYLTPGASANSVVTPEPSTLVLLSTGLLGCLGAVGGEAHRRGAVLGGAA